MNVVGELVWKINGDASGYKKTYSEVDKKNESLAKSFKKVDISAKVFGEQSTALQKKQDILRSKMQGLIDKGVSPSNKGFKKLSSLYNENQKELDKVTKKTSGYGFALKAAAVAAGLLIASKLKQFFGGAIDAASDAAETAQKFGNVFPGITKKANATAKALTSVANVSLSESKALLATSGNLLQSIGATEEVALSYGAELAKMAADLKSFNNLTESTEMVQQRLTKALLGEREALIGVDIKLGEKDLAAYAKTQGIVWKNATRLEKAEVTMAALRDKSRLATDDVIKSSGTYAQVTRALANRQKDLAEDVGKEMLPALTDLKKAFLDTSDDGGFLYNALVSIGKVVGKVIQFVTLLVQTMSLLNNVNSGSKKSIEDIVKISKKWGVSSKEVGDLVGLQKLGLIDLNKEMFKAREGTSKYSVETVNAAKEASSAWDANSKDTKKSLTDVKETFSKLIGTFDGATKTGVKGFKNVSTSLKEATKESKKLAKTFDQLSTPEKFDLIAKGVLSVADAVIGMLSAIDSFTQASADAASERLEIDRQNALEAAGVAEETNLQKAQRELEIAKEKGDAELIQEKETEVKRAKINEEYDKKQAELDYNANLRSWELQMAMAKIQMITAPLNAYVSALATPIIGPYIAPGLAALAAITAGYQFAAVQESKPTRPRYAEGGIIPGTPSGTEIIAGENNKDEIIMNQNQMANTLMAIANGGGSGKEIVIHNYIMLEGEMIDEYVTRSSTDGRILSSSRATVRR